MLNVVVMAALSASAELPVWSTQYPWPTPGAVPKSGLFGSPAPPYNGNGPGDLGWGGSSWYHKQTPWPKPRTGYTGNDCRYDGGWWYGAVAWNGCPPVYIPPICPTPLCNRYANVWDPSLNTPAVPTTLNSSSMSSTTPPKTDKTEPAPGTGTGTGERASRAQLLIELPPGAKLFVDGQPIAVEKGKRSLSTPELKAGEIYYYDLKVEALDGDTTATQTRKVVVRAGEEVRASFVEKTAAGTETAER